MTFSHIFLILLYLIVIAIDLFKKKECLYLFIFTIIVSSFVTIGPAWSIYTFSFTNAGFFALITTLIELFYLLNKGFKIQKPLIFYSVALIAVVLIGFLDLYFEFLPNPDVVLWSDSIDAVAVGLSSLQRAKFTRVNITAFFNMTVFILFMLLNSRFFTKKHFNKISCSLIACFKILIIFILIEFAITNYINHSLIRLSINTLFGTGANSFLTSQFRGIGYCSFALFSEPSSVAVLFFFYCLLCSRTKLKMNDYIFIVLSFAAAICSTSTSAIASCLLGFVVLLYYKTNFAGKTFVLFTALLIVLVASILDFEYFDIQKISDFINGTGSGSGFIRHFGNDLCYKAFFSKPLFGCGLNTTRGYGFIPGMLSNLGIIGSLLLLLFLKRITSFCFKGSVFYCLIVIVFLLFNWSTWFMYSPTIILIFTFKNKRHNICLANTTMNKSTNNYSNSYSLLYL